MTLLRLAALIGWYRWWALYRIRRMESEGVRAMSLTPWHLARTEQEAWAELDRLRGNPDNLATWIETIWSREPNTPWRKP